MSTDLEPGVAFTAFPDRQAASRAAAELLAAGLREALAERGKGSLVLSGGTTPGDCYARLAAESLDWRRVSLVPSDERWVPADDVNSNERLIRERLQQNGADAARIVPLYRPGLEPADAPAVIERDLVALGSGFSGVLLGMGADGHFASLFPDFSGLGPALDPHGAQRCMVVSTASSPFPRISLTLAALLQTPWIALLFFGPEKRRVFEAAAEGETNYPVRALLAQPDVPVRALWAP